LIERCRMRVWLHAVLVVFSLWGGCAAAQMPSAAQITDAPFVPDIAVRGDWQVVCGSDGCQAEPQRRGSSDLSLAVVTEGEGEVRVLRAPLGLLLGEGVKVEVDGRSLGRLAFLTCEVDGCVAPVRLDGVIRRALRGGNTLSVELLRRTGEAISAEYSLIGFIAATDLLREAVPGSSITK
jgi:invasion protein IalB